MKLLALPKLPERNPVKRTIVCAPELNEALEEYALLYRETYGEAESVETSDPVHALCLPGQGSGVRGFSESPDDSKRRWAEHEKACAQRRAMTTTRGRNSI